MAKQLDVRPRQVDITTRVRIDTSGSPEVATRPLPIKTAVVDTAERRGED